MEQNDKPDDQIRQMAAKEAAISKESKPAEPNVEKTWMPLVARAILIVIFVVEVLSSLNWFDILFFLIPVGGVCAMLRRIWGLALTGSIVAILFALFLILAKHFILKLFPPSEFLLALSLLTSIASLILIVLSKKKFIKPTKTMLLGEW